mmetsp:Transcript_27577/g.67165  ORF Transcript_27577/g.67165 Transcript_27577/m.67165 type:complete len:203 (-) Transcript_27577:381-989(-)
MPPGRLSLPLMAGLALLPLFFSSCDLACCISCVLCLFSLSFFIRATLCTLMMLLTSSPLKSCTSRPSPLASCLFLRTALLAALPLALLWMSTAAFSCSLPIMLSLFMYRSWRRDMQSKNSLKSSSWTSLSALPLPPWSRLADRKARAISVLVMWFGRASRYRSILISSFMSIVPDRLDICTVASPLNFSNRSLSAWIPTFPK